MEGPSGGVLWWKRGEWLWGELLWEDAAATRAAASSSARAASMACNENQRCQSWTTGQQQQPVLRVAQLHFTSWTELRRQARM